MALGMEVGYVMKYAAKWEVNTKRDASEFDAGYYGKLMQEAWLEVSFALKNANY